jgi:DnaJ-class molecular chaperone
MNDAEICALARMLDRMDYYKLFRIERDDPAPKIRAAYLTMRRSFHPDAHLGSSGEVRAAVGEISRRVNEAFQVLRDPAKRATYDKGIESGELRFTARAEEATQKETAAQYGATDSGKRFWKDAMTAEGAGDLEGAIKAVKMALTFEGENERFKKKLAELEARAPKKTKKKANPFAIK